MCMYHGYPGYRKVLLLDHYINAEGGSPDQYRAKLGSDVEAWARDAFRRTQVESSRQTCSSGTRFCISSMAADYC